MFAVVELISSDVGLVDPADSVGPSIADLVHRHPLLRSAVSLQTVSLCPSPCQRLRSSSQVSADDGAESQI